MFKITRLIDLINGNGQGESVPFKCVTDDIEKVRKEKIKERRLLDKTVTDVVFIYKEVNEEVLVDTVSEG